MKQLAELKARSEPRFLDEAIALPPDNPDETDWMKEAREKGFSNSRIQDLERIAEIQPGLTDLHQLMRYLSNEEIRNKIDDLLRREYRIRKKDFLELLEEYKPYVELNKYWKEYDGHAKGKPVGSPPVREQLEAMSRRLHEVPGRRMNYRRWSIYPLGFKSESRKNEDPEREPMNEVFKNAFPIKQQQKRFSLHHFMPPNSYMVDIAFFNDFENNTLAFLILVNVNTRKAYAGLLNGVEVDERGSIKLLKNSKTETQYLQTLCKILNDNKVKLDYLKGDGEKAFTSKLVNKFYKQAEAVFVSVPLSFGHSNHTSLAIIDRVIRTIRDALYNMGIDYMNPELMQEILRQYNEKPHRTLSEVFNTPVAPNDVTPEMELSLIRNAKQRNWKTLNQGNFKLKAGSKVLVYNDLDPMVKRRSLVRKFEYEVVGFKNGLYTIRGPEGKLHRVSRYKLKTIDEK
jgi:hypothetical protein